jgi:hypothetical protein
MTARPARSAALALCLAGAGLALIGTPAHADTPAPASSATSTPHTALPSVQGVQAATGLPALPGAARSRDSVRIGRVTLTPQGIDVAVTYRCAALGGADELRVAVTDAEDGGVHSGSVTPVCDGTTRSALVRTARAAGPAALPGRDAVVTASLGTETGGVLFSTSARDGGTRVLERRG